MNRHRRTASAPSSTPRRCAAGLLLACLVIDAGPEAQTISGAGSRDCRAFNAAVERDSQPAIDSYLSWAQGFISGVNVANRQGINVAIDHAGLFHWLARYCVAHREAMLFEALNELSGLRQH